MCTIKFILAVPLVAALLSRYDWRLLLCSLLDKHEFWFETVFNISSITGASPKNVTCDAPVSACTPASTSKLSCRGTGKIFEVPDSCINDGGVNAAGDSLEIYCVCNRARFCLSGEACPWRIPTVETADNGRTCSRAGLTSSYMANGWCNLWRNHTQYDCCYDGFIGFWFNVSGVVTDSVFVE